MLETGSALSTDASTAAPPARVLVVDDHEVVREGLAVALPDGENFEVVGTAASGREGLDAVERIQPDIVLVDLRLADMSGEQLTRELRSRFPGTAVVILTSYLGEGTVRAALEAGAAAYVTKAAGLSELRAALFRVTREIGPYPGETGATQIVEQLHALIAGRIDSGLPTPRQTSVLELVAQGLTNAEIGDRLGISESTVRFHVQKMKERLCARTRTDLVAKAIRAGLITPAADSGLAPELRR